MVVSQNTEQKQRRILIAEDEHPLAHALELKLTHEGFMTKTVSNGEEALAILKDEQFDLILLDLIMPKVDGFEVLQALQGRKPFPKLIVLSNLGQEEDIARTRQLGAIDYCVKSNTPIKAIVELIRRTLDHS